MKLDKFKNISKDGKVRKLVKIKGEGATPKKGQKVQLNYKGYFQDYKVFDERFVKEPFECVLGEGLLIDGWEKALLTMQENEDSTIYIHYDEAYEDRGAIGTIPGKTCLYFDIKMLKILDNKK